MSRSGESAPVAPHISSATPSVSGVRPEDDEEVMRIPVFNRPTVAGHALYLFQYPLRPQWRPYELDTVSEARIRPQQRRVELKLPVDQSSSSYNEHSNYPLEHIELTSTLVSSTSSYAIGMLRRNKDGEPLSVHLMPLDHSVQMRPAFTHVDESAGARSSGAATPAGRGDGSVAGPSDAAGSDDDEAMEAEEEETTPAKKVAGPVFRAAATEKEIEARRSSHAYLMEQLEQEPWVTAKFFPPGSDESGMMRERLGFVGE